MRVVVSGAAGFIGSHLVDALLDRGYRVTGIDRQSRSALPGYRHAVQWRYVAAATAPLPFMVAT